MSCLVNSVVNAFAKESKYPDEKQKDDFGQFGDLYLARKNTAASLRNGAIGVACVAVAAALVTLVAAAIIFGAPLAALAALGATLGALTLPLFVGAAVITVLSLTAFAIFLVARHQVSNMQKDDKHRGEYYRYNDGVALRLPDSMTREQFDDLTRKEQEARCKRL